MRYSSLEGPPPNLPAGGQGPHYPDRHHFDAKFQPVDLADTYYPAFKRCVEEAEVSQIMCSYNAVDGIPACVNSDLMRGVLREKWGFDGGLVSDCGALADVYQYVLSFNPNRRKARTDRDTTPSSPRVWEGLTSTPRTRRRRLQKRSQLGWT